MKNFRFPIVLFCFLIITAHSTAQKNWWGNGISGEGPLVTKILSLDKLDGVSLGISGDVFLTQGNTQSIKVEGQENIIGNLKTSVKSGVWHIGFEENVKKHKPLKVYITIPQLTVASVSGSGNMETTGKFKGLQDLKVAVSGSGDLNLNIDARNIRGKVSGSGDIALSGNSNELDLSVSGSGSVDAFPLQSLSCDISISGSGTCKVSVKDDLKASVSGSGEVYYKGNPNVRSRISGSGDVVSRN